MLHPGELVGIIGPNGAGKSTLLKALFGLVPIRQGSVVLGGDEITNQRADKLVRRGVGFVPQTNNVFPSLTIEENLRMGIFRTRSGSPSGSSSSPTSSRPSGSAGASVRARSRAVSARWSRWRAR